MNRLTIRTLLRRRLNESVPDNWDDDTLNQLIDIAYGLVLKQVRKVDPEALLFWAYRDTIAGTSWYEKPAGSRGPAEVAVKITASDDWLPLKRKPYFVARDWAGTTNEPVYCHRGQFLGIFPAPINSVTNGLRLIHVPTDSLATDTDSPRLEITLQYAIILWSALLAKGESPESDTKDAAELQRILGDIPSDYGTNDYNQPMAFDPDVADARGRYPFGIKSGYDPGRQWGM